MDWPLYRELCDRPEYQTRWMLEQTGELLVLHGDVDLEAALRAAMKSDPLEKPPDFRAGPQTDVFRLQLTASEASAIAERVLDCVTRGVSTSATRKRGLAGFAEAWAEVAAVEWPESGP